jgi:uncharacterized protein with GYD domain
VRKTFLSLVSDDLGDRCHICLKEGGSSRRDTISKLIQGMGGSVESFYFAFGEADVYVTVDLPDNISAAALALAINSMPATHIKTTVLQTSPPGAEP